MPTVARRLISILVVIALTLAAVEPAIAQPRQPKGAEHKGTTEKSVVPFFEWCKAAAVLAGGTIATLALVVPPPLWLSLPMAALVGASIGIILPVTIALVLQSMTSGGSAKEQSREGVTRSGPGTSATLLGVGMANAERH